MIPADAESVRIEPYQPGSHECCCGNPECTDFESRMMAWGIPLDEITTVSYEVGLPVVSSSADWVIRHRPENEQHSADDQQNQSDGPED